MYAYAKGLMLRMLLIGFIPLIGNFTSLYISSLHPDGYVFLHTFAS